MAAKFWVGGTGNLDGSTTTNISDTSGGAGGAVYPVAGDTLTFDGASGGGTVTFTAALSITTLTTGAHTGTINTNGQTVTVSGVFSISGTATRTVTFGASAISCGTWTATTTTGLTFNVNTSTITQTGATTFAGGGLTYATVVFTGTGPTITGANTFGTLTRTGTAAKTDTFNLGANQTVSGTVTINGDSSINRVLVRSDTRGTARTITAATVVVTNADFQDITGAGAGSWNLSAITGGSGDCGGNTSITFTTAANQYWKHGASASYNWSDSTLWFLATNGGGGAGRVPLPQDDAFFDANSFAASGKTVSNNMPRLAKSISWAGNGAGAVTNSPTWTHSSTSASIFGSLTLTSGVTISGAVAYTLEGRASFGMTSAGKTFANQFTLDAPGGTYTQQDAFITTSTMTLSKGTWSDGGFNLTCSSFNDSGSATRGLTMGTGTTWTLTGEATNIWFLTATGMTLTPGTATIRLAGTLTAARSFVGGGLTYYNVENATSGAFALRFSGSNTFNNLHIDASAAARTVLFTAGSTTTVASMTRNAGINVITLGSITASSHTLTKTGGGTITMDYMDISRSTATPGSTWYATHSTDSGNNSGWTFAQSMTADAGSFTVTGQAVNLNLTYYLALAAGSFTVNGQAVNLSVAQAANTITAEAGAIVVTGQAVNFTIYTTMEVSPGVFTVVGQDVRFVVGRDSIQVEGIAFAKPGTLTPEFATPGAVSVSLDTPGASGAAWENL